MRQVRPRKRPSEGPSQDFPGLRVRSRQVVSHVGRGAAPARARAGYRGWRSPARGCRRSRGAARATSRSMPLKSGIGIDGGCRPLVERHPAVCIIDGLAYNNPPAARNPTRWQDVQDLLDAGIKVIGVHQHPIRRRVAGTVEAVTGKHVTRDRACVVHQERRRDRDRGCSVRSSRWSVARRTEAGAQARRSSLSRLRELALVLAADVVDHQLKDYLETAWHPAAFRHAGTDDGVHHAARQRRAKCWRPRSIIAERFHGELIVAYVSQPDISAAGPGRAGRETGRSPGPRARTSKSWRARTRSTAILEFARSRGVTQLFVGHSQRPGVGRGSGATRSIS